MTTYGVKLTEEGMLSKTNCSVGLVMGSDSDWPYIRPAATMLERLKIRYEYGVVSAHRTHERLSLYGTQAMVRGLKSIIACAGGSAHLPGMLASMTLLPVYGVAPKKSDGAAVGSMIAMPSGKPLAYMGGGSDDPGKGNAGASNAALHVARTLALFDLDLAERLRQFDEELTNSIPYWVND